MALSVHIKKKLKDFELAVDFDMDEGIVKTGEKRNSGTSLRTVPHKRIGELLPSPYFRWTAAKSRPCPNDGSRAKVFIVR